MARTSSSGPFDEGAHVRVKPGVTAPELPDVLCAGWTGQIAERVGKKTDPKYVVAWDDATLAALPEGYRERCEQKGLLYEMSCFAADDLEPADGE
jgi:hypothetical protein